ncbi:MAG: 50S ribosomal protein L13 [Clostridia bacterium]|nr:50S ribosomal protein L13 [Clostridia bacterium]
MNTYVVKGNSIERKWYVVDASGLTLGRLASQVAAILRGKNKPTFTPNLDTGDYVIVVNADKIVLTGKKLEKKMYYHHTGYRGGLRDVSAGKLLAKNPERVIELAVKGMLPKNALGRQMYRKLKVYAGPEHEHQAQQPEVLTLVD